MKNELSWIDSPTDKAAFEMQGRPDQVCVAHVSARTGKNPDPKKRELVALDRKTHPSPACGRQAEGARDGTPSSSFVRGVTREAPREAVSAKLCWRPASEGGPYKEKSYGRVGWRR